MQKPPSSSRRGRSSEPKVALSTMWALGNNIQKKRRAARMTQSRLADHPKLLVTRQTVSRWETGQCMPERHHLTALAEIFGITTDQLFEVDRRRL